jgi:hypothetical protein
LVVTGGRGSGDDIGGGCVGGVCKGRCVLAVVVVIVVVVSSSWWS